MGPPELVNFWANLRHPPTQKHPGLGQGAAGTDFSKHEVLLIVRESRTLRWSMRGVGFESTVLEDFLETVDVVELFQLVFIDVIFRVSAEDEFRELEKIGSVMRLFPLLLPLSLSC